jgi:hypothetical protein
MTLAELRRLAAWLAPPLVVGALLRFANLRDQLLTGDELHAVNAALAWPVGRILQSWTYAGADYSVPLAALYRFALDRGAALSEMGFRAPVLACGLVSLVAIPWAFAPRIGRSAAGVLAWLLALSPMWVLYGRMVRSYVPMALVATLAILAFDRWRRRPAAAPAAAFVALAALAVYLHLGAASFVGAPFAFAAVAALRRPAPERRRALRDLLLLGACWAAALALLLWPARASLVALVGLHGDGELPGLRTWGDVLRLELGTPHWSLAALMLAAAGRGALLLWRRDRSFALYLATLAALHVGALALVSPHLFQQLLVVNRYLLVCLPCLLALAALGLAAPLRPDAAPSRAQGLAAAACVALLLVTGPLAGERFRTSSFVHSPSSLTFTGPADRVAPERVPDFYRRLASAQDGGRRAIVEFPWMNVATHAFDAYQAVHQRPVRAGSLNRLHSDPRLALRNLLAPEPAAFLASGARYLVVHADLRSEEERVHTTLFLFRKRLENLDELWTALRTAGVRMAARLELAWGAPDYADAAIRVWDLDAVRGRAAAGQLPASPPPG